MFRGSDFWVFGRYSDVFGFLFNSLVYFLVGEVYMAYVISLVSFFIKLYVDLEKF